MNFLKNYTWILIVALYVGYFYFFQKKPCETPILYKIGNFDTGFGISREDFLKAVDESSKIWGNGIQKNLFEYNPKGNLTINLIYDDRQKTTQKNEVLKADINKINQLASSIKQQYLSLESDYSVKEKDYKDLLVSFNQRNNNYNDQVSYWNSKGGAPKDEYIKLNEEKDSLVAENANLENKRLEINNLASQINDFIHKYNLLVGNENTNINTINQSAGKEFEEGLYYSGKNEIDIYEFSTNQKLIRVLTHELGHALDLPHNDNPNSIMYALNQGDTLTLSKDDLEELKTKCKIK